jgi:hypothetical protein
VEDFHFFHFHFLAPNVMTGWLSLFHYGVLVQQMVPSKSGKKEYLENYCSCFPTDMKSLFFSSLTLNFAGW